MNREQELKLTEAVIELRESNKSLSQTMLDIRENLKTLNDQNVLHVASSKIEHDSFMTQIQLLTGKYWWLIISLLVVVLIIMGYKEAVGLMLA